MGILEEQNKEHHYLFPSNLFVSKKPIQIQTILGSCVAVCLFDNHNKYGGVNHYMVPLWNGEGLASPKFGNIAIETLIENMIAVGSQKKDLVAKIFGGASQFDNKNELLAVGDRNIQIAKSMLGNYRIPIVSESLGGVRGRKILFDTSTGQVMMKYIIKQKNIK
jgi:chemotaxis protein CheD